ncbi:MAG: hypothetical protein JXR78_16680 [Victivallales bacterium]|nr:hypothetical protein [Victivallales bacterium]
MMRLLVAISLTLPLVILTGCGTVGNLSSSELLAPGLAIGGASLGAFVSENEDNGTRLAATAGGGLIGWISGLFVTEGIKAEKKDEFRSGYELGQSNATKSLYWNIQELHEAKKHSDGKVVYYQIPADYPADGARRTPGSVIMPIVQKSE